MKNNLNDNIEKLINKLNDRKNSNKLIERLTLVKWQISNTIKVY